MMTGALPYWSACMFCRCWVCTYVAWRSGCSNWLRIYLCIGYGAIAAMRVGTACCVSACALPWCQRRIRIALISLRPIAAIIHARRSCRGLPMHDACLHVSIFLQAFYRFFLTCCFFEQLLRRGASALSAASSPHLHLLLEFAAHASLRGILLFAHHD